MADRFEALYLGSIFNKKKTPPCCPLVAIDDSATVTYTGLGTPENPFVFTAAGGTDLTLTTSGTSGASTLVAGVLNIPNYTFAGVSFLNSTSVILSGNGTSGSPLAATLTTPTNGLQLITGAVGLGGTLTQNAVINNGTGHFNIQMTGINFDSGGAAALTINTSDNGVFRYTTANAGALVGPIIKNSVSGAGAAAGYICQTDTAATGFFYETCTNNNFVSQGLLIANNSGTGGVVIAATAGPITFNSALTQPVSTSEYARFSAIGHFGLGINAPTAVLHIKAGTATAGTAPIKLTSGVNLTTPEDGTLEYDGTNLYFTVGSTRKTFTLI
jgi:hypothetical protein